MDVERIKEIVERQPGLSRTLGMVFYSTPMAAGINVSGNHVKVVSEGEVVTARGRLLHKGRTLHVWQIDIENESGELISTVQVTNYIIKIKK